MTGVQTCALPISSVREQNKNRSGRSRALRSDLTSKKPKGSSNLQGPARSSFAGTDRATNGALSPSGGGVYRWSKKALICRNCKARSASRVAFRSVGRAVGAIPRSDHEPTKRTQAPWLPSGRIPSRGCGRAGSLGRRRCGDPWLPASDHPGDDDRGCSSLASRRGARNPPEATRPKAWFLPGLRALHSALLGPCCSDPQGTGLPPSTEADVIERSVLAA